MSVDETKGSPPGHRFGLYYAGWEDGWRKKDKGKEQVLQTCSDYGDVGGAVLAALTKRRRCLASRIPEDRRFEIEGKATAPFMTGLGREHPLENGFAFLWPYGLPYLAGSGVKGVLRDAAREVGLDGEKIRWLFGPEPPRTRRGEAPEDAPRNRGALVFWDVLPQPPSDGAHKDAMRVDVMTPHFVTYLEGKGPPHESDGPKPIPFLTMPPGTRFHFVVEFRPPGTVPEAVRGSWKEDLRECFEHAFDFLGFGAKTAIGYGAIEKTGGGGDAGDPGSTASADRGDPEQLEQLVEELRTVPEQRVHEIFNRKSVWFGGSLLVRLCEALLEAYERIGADRFARRVAELRRIIESGGRE